MAKNFQQTGNLITFLVSQIVAPQTLPKSGDACVIGRMAGVAQTDGVTGGSIAVAVRGVWKVPVVGSGNGVSAGESVFIDPTTAIVSTDLADVPFGIALETVSAGATTTIAVWLFGGTPGATGFGS